MSTATDTWPRGLREIAGIVGPRSALELADAYGGVPIYIPKQPTPGHVFAPLLEATVFAEVCTAYGGTWLTIPRGTHLDLKRTRVESLLGSMSHRRIALEVGVTERYVRKLANAGAKPKQMELPIY